MADTLADAEFFVRVEAVASWTVALFGLLPIGIMQDGPVRPHRPSIRWRDHRHCGEVNVYKANTVAYEIP